MWTAKPTASKLSSWVRKQARKLAKEREQRIDKAEQRKRDLAIRAFVFRRDVGRCRATGVKLYMAHTNPFKVGHCHHIVYRSAGGLSTPSNLVLLSPEAHVAEHDGRLDISGNPNETLTFTERDRTGRVLRTWESPCPTR